MLFLLLLLAMPAGLAGEEPPRNPEGPIKITGKCYNVTTAETVPCTARTSNANAYKREQTSKPGALDFELDRATTLLYFDAPGYETNSFPVHRIGEIPEHTTFEIQVPLIPNGLPAATRADQLALAPNTLLALNLQFPDSLEMMYIMHDMSTQTTSSTFTFRQEKGKPMLMRTAIPGPYVFRAMAGQSDQISLEDILTNENVIIKAGLNLMEVNGVMDTTKRIGKPVSKPESTPTGNTGSLILPFSQSSYALSPTVKIALDSIATLLKTHRNRTATMVGHTDNVGKRMLNVTLSEYRVRVVANYLLQKGILRDQLIMNWKGPDAPLAPNDSEENKVRNRRVELQLNVMD